MMLGLSMSGDITWLGTLDNLGGLILGFLVKTRAKIQSLRSAPESSSNLDSNELTAAPQYGTSLISKGNKSLPNATTRSLQQNPVSTEPVKERPLTKLKQKIKATSEIIAEEKPHKKLKIEPFEKKSKGTVSEQGALFEAGELPSLSLLRRSEGIQETGYSAENLEDMSRLLESKLADFGVKIEVVAVSPGPVFPRFEFQPAPCVMASKISNLAQDLARSLAMTSVRVVEVIPGKSVMGLEVPNENRAMVHLGDVLASK
jgi:S-DNA-T family DNA segregation ATPase FtsK/SpoIIIE